MKKALGLLSGGLDSILATRLVLEQGVEVVAVNFILPFTPAAEEKQDYAGAVAERLGIPLVRVEAGEEYLEVVRSPKYGYGSGLNPCVDCRIFMLREAKRVAESEEVGADFVFTGDVLGERPMSQHRKALELEEKEAGLEGQVLRPLSARLLPTTIPEREGWVKRSGLLGIKGKSRKPQIALAKRFGLRRDEYPTPAGGCLLTYKEFAAKARDLFEHRERENGKGGGKVTRRDILLLRVGRHFRFGSSKIIVGRNEEENKVLAGLRSAGDFVFEVPGCGSPTTLLVGSEEEEAVELAARLTARYSDAGAEAGAEGKGVLVEYRSEKERRSILVLPSDETEVFCLRV